MLILTLYERCWNYLVVGGIPGDNLLWRCLITSDIFHLHFLEFICLYIFCWGKIANSAIVVIQNFLSLGSWKSVEQENCKLGHCVLFTFPLEFNDLPRNLLV